MKKRVIIVLLIAVLLFVSACGAKNPPETNVDIGLSALSKEDLISFFEQQGYLVGILQEEYYENLDVNKDHISYVMTVSPKTDDGHDFILVFKSKLRAQAFYSKHKEGHKIFGKMVVKDEGLGEVAAFFEAALTE